MAEEGQHSVSLYQSGLMEAYCDESMQSNGCSSFTARSTNTDQVAETENSTENEGELRKP